MISPWAHLDVPVVALQPAVAPGHDHRPAVVVDQEVEEGGGGQEAGEGADQGGRHQPAPSPGPRQPAPGRHQRQRVRRLAPPPHREEEIFQIYSLTMTGVAAVANIVYRNSLSLIISSHLEILGTISTQLTAETTLVWSGGGRTGSACWLGSCDFFRCVPSTESSGLLYLSSDSVSMSPVSHHCHCSAAHCWSLLSAASVNSLLSSYISTCNIF